MNRILFPLLSLFLIALCPMTARASDEARKKGAAEPSKKEQYEKSMEQRLGTIGKQLDQLRAKVNTGTEEARQDLNQYMKDAEKKQDTAVRKLEELRKASNKKWKKFASDVDKAADDFEQAYDKASKRFKE